MFIRSTDKGKTWSALQKLTIRNLLDISFADSLNGITVGQGGEVYTTTNAGVEWRKTQFDSPGLLVSCKAFSDGHYLVADKFYGNVFVSSDFGISWDTLRAYHNASNDSTWKQTVKGVFLDSLNWYIVGTRYINGYYYPLIIKTTDKGRNWQTVVDSSYYVGDLFSLAFQTKDFGIAVGRGYNLLYTTNGGETWQHDTLKASINWDYVSDIVFLPGNNLLCVTRALYSGFVLSGSTKQSVSQDQLLRSDSKIISLSDKIDIPVTGAKVRSVKIYDNIGRLTENISSLYPVDNSLLLDLSGYSEGMYHIMVNYENSTVSRFTVVKISNK